MQNCIFLGLVQRDHQINFVNVHVIKLHFQGFTPVLLNVTADLVATVWRWSTNDASVEQNKR
jgi:hypothetical protein